MRIESGIPLSWKNKGAVAQIVPPPIQLVSTRSQKPGDYEFRLHYPEPFYVDAEGREIK